MRVRAFLDANIITSKTLRDWLFKLSLEDAETLTLISSEKVLAEARRAFQKRNPTAGPEAVAGLFDRIRSVLSHVVDDSDVVSMEIEGISGHDLHVHRAALSTEATHLVTLNLRDFQPRQPIPYRVSDPDHLLIEIYLHSPDAVHAVTASEFQYWAERHRYGWLVKTLPAALLDAGASRFSEIIGTILRPEISDEGEPG